VILSVLVIAVLETFYLNPDTLLTGEDVLGLFFNFLLQFTKNLKILANVSTGLLLVALDQIVEELSSLLRLVKLGVSHAPSASMIDASGVLLDKCQGTLIAAEMI
jgi:hypothetical protein